MKYVVKNSNGMYVSAPGREQSFCKKLKHCRVFESEEEAKADCCGNEWPVNVDSIPKDSYFFS